MTEDPSLISIRAFAQLAGVTRPAIQKAIKCGRLTAVDPITGKLFRSEALEEWAALHQPPEVPDPEAAETLLEEIGEEAPDPGPGEAEKQNWGIAYTRESTLLKRKQREKLSLETAELKSKLLRTEDVEAAWSEIVTAARAKLLALPAEVAGAIGIRLKRDRVVVQDIVAREVERVLAELATDSNAKTQEHRARRVKKWKQVTTPVPDS